MRLWLSYNELFLICFSFLKYIDGMLLQRNCVSGIVSLQKQFLCMYLENRVHCVHIYLVQLRTLISKMFYFKFIICTFFGIFLCSVRNSILGIKCFWNTFSL